MIDYKNDYKYRYEIRSEQLSRGQMKKIMQFITPEGYTAEMSYYTKAFLETFGNEKSFEKITAKIYEALATYKKFTDCKISLTIADDNCLVQDYYNITKAGVEKIRF